jgi:hypothetical protein
MVCAMVRMMVHDGMMAVIATCMMARMMVRVMARMMAHDGA